MANNIKNLANLKHGKLTLLEDSGKRTPHGSVVWKCLCDCGNICEVSSSNLKSTKSCGCHRKTYNRKNALDVGEASLNGLYYEYVRSAKKRNKNFQLTKEQFKILTSSNCHYCHKPPFKIYYKEGCKGEYRFNGIDRKDNSKGYTSENSLPCCWECNNIKSNTLSYEEMMVVAKALLDFRSK